MSSQAPEINVIISGGGTGGHIFPALAIARALKNMNPNNKILFVGASGRMEMEKVPAAGFEITGLNISGIQRKLSLSNLKIPFQLIASIVKARGIIKKFKPDVVVGVGGYASGPVLFTAGLMGKACLIQEQNSYAGVTNRILGKISRRICVAYENMQRYFPASKIILTGNPVRQDIESGTADKTEGLDHFSLKEGRTTVLIIGGSLGARTINESVYSGWRELLNDKMQIIWQTGKSYYEKAKSIERESGGAVRVLEFIPAMSLAYAAADIIVSRAGASSLSELCIVGKPCILIPSPNVAEDHQTKNAMALVHKQAAVLVRDSDARNELPGVIKNLIGDKERCEKLSHNISGLAHRNADRLIALEVYKLSGKQQIK